MDHRLTQHKPSLLLVSHCVPDALGGADRARLWQLLKLANATHRVCLACLLDGPVNLSQWRNTHGLAGQFAIEIDHKTTRLITHWGRPSARRVHWRRGTDTAIADPIGQWQSNQTFDVVWSTHPALWPVAHRCPARLRLCDIGLSALAHSRGKGSRLDPLIAMIANQADALTLDSNEASYRWRSCPCDVVATPTTVDLAFFTDTHAHRLTKRHAPSGPHVVVHHDWSRPDAQRALRSFTRRVWPRIHRAVPGACLRNTIPGSLDPLSTLRNASVVICLDPDPRYAKLPVYQAMAMGRAVLASGRALGGPSVAGAHGHPMMLANSSQDWSQLTIQLLRSAGTRLSLSRNAHEWIGRLPGIGGQAQKVARLLAGTDTTPQAMPKAA